MRGVHFSLRWLFGVVSFLAVGCGLLIYASPLLSKLAFTAAVTVFLGALSAAVYHSGDRRAFWGGFAAFGLAYLWMVCGAWQSPDGSTPLRERLVTSDLLGRCYERLPSTQPSASVSSTSTAMAWLSYAQSPIFNRNTSQTVGTSGGGSLPDPLVMTSTAVARSDFLTTGHSLFAILFALLGGAITRRCSSGARDRGDVGPRTH